MWPRAGPWFVDSLITLALLSALCQGMAVGSYVSGTRDLIIIAPQLVADVFYAGYTASPNGHAIVVVSAWLARKVPGPASYAVLTFGGVYATGALCAATGFWTSTAVATAGGVLVNVAVTSHDWMMALTCWVAETSSLLQYHWNELLLLPAAWLWSVRPADTVASAVMSQSKAPKQLVTALATVLPMCQARAELVPLLVMMTMVAMSYALSTAPARGLWWRLAADTTSITADRTNATADTDGATAANGGANNPADDCCEVESADDSGWEPPLVWR